MGSQRLNKFLTVIVAIIFFCVTPKLISITASDMFIFYILISAILYVWYNYLIEINKLLCGAVYVLSSIPIALLTAHVFNLEIWHACVMTLVWHHLMVLFAESYLTNA